MTQSRVRKIVHRLSRYSGLLLAICGLIITAVLLAGGGVSGAVQIVLDHPGSSTVMLWILGIVGPVFILSCVARLWWIKPWICVTLGTALAVALVAGFSFLAAVWIEVPSREEFRQLAAKQSYSIHILDRDGRSLGVYHPVQRGGGIHVPLDTLPEWFVGDLKAIEGWNEYGVSIPGIGRSIAKRVVGLRAGGASTITMQTYRILTAHTDSSLFRKACEAVSAVKMSLTFTEEQILRIYINNIRWADEGGHNGLGYAARRLFSKHPSELTRSEGLALMSGLSEPERSDQLHADSVGLELRRKYNNRVDLLRREGRLSQEEYKSLHDSLPAPDRHRISASTYGLFKGQVIDNLGWMLGPTAWSLDDGLVVETTLDTKINRAASKALAGGPLREGMRGTFLLLNRENQVVAYATDEKLLRTGDDLFTSNNTMPASRWKPVVYTCLAGQMLPGHTGEEVLDLKLPTRYRVHDDFVVDDNIPQDSLTVRQALLRSKDAPVYYVVNELLTPTYVKRCAKRLQIPGLRALPSIGIGSMGVSELNLAGAYSTLFVRNGFYRRPSFIRRISTKTGQVIYDSEDHPRRNSEPQVASEAAAKLIEQVLREAVYKEEGTSSEFPNEAPNIKGFDVATKTGTSSNKSDYRYRGFTGTVAKYTFSTTVQGKYLTGYASETALPLSAAVFNRLRSKNLFP